MRLAPSRCSRRAASVRLNPTESVTNLLSTVAKGKACHASASLAVDTAGPFAERTAATGGRRPAHRLARGWGRWRSQRCDPRRADPLRSERLVCAEGPQAAGKPRLEVGSAGEAYDAGAAAGPHGRDTDGQPGLPCPRFDPLSQCRRPQQPMDTDTSSTCVARDHLQRAGVHWSGDSLLPGNTIE